MGLLSLNMQSSVLISASRDHVWQVFSDVRRWTQWSPVTLRSDVSEGFDWREGEELWLKLRMAGVGVPFHVRITKSQTPGRVAWASTQFTVTAVRTFMFDETADGTRVTDHKAFRSPVLPIWTFYPRPIIRRMTESFLADLKRECERTT
jgi:hypothetical protein